MEYTASTMLTRHGCRFAEICFSSFQTMPRRPHSSSTIQRHVLDHQLQDGEFHGMAWSSMSVVYPQSLPSFKQNIYWYQAHTPTQLFVRDYVGLKHTDDATEAGVNNGLELSSNSGDHLSCAAPMYITTQSKFLVLCLILLFPIIPNFIFQECI